MIKFNQFITDDQAVAFEEASVVSEMKKMGIKRLIPWKI